MRRREFITLLGGGLAAWPLAAPAPAQSVPVIGFLSSASRDQLTQQLAAFQQGLSEAGYVDGRSVAIEYRSAEGQYDRLPALAADLVRRNVNLIATSGGSSSALAACRTNSVSKAALQSSDNSMQIMSGEKGTRSPLAS